MLIMFEEKTLGTLSIALHCHYRNSKCLLCQEHRLPFFATQTSRNRQLLPLHLFSMHQRQQKTIPNHVENFLHIEAFCMSLTMSVAGLPRLVGYAA